MGMRSILEAPKKPIDSSILVDVAGVFRVGDRPAMAKNHYVLVSLPGGLVIALISSADFSKVSCFSAYLDPIEPPAVSIWQISTSSPPGPQTLLRH